MRVAAIQMNSQAEVDSNLQLADRLLGEAAADGCLFAVLPENFALMPIRSRDKAKHAEEPGDGPIQRFLADAARRHGLWIVAGSMPLRSPESERVYGGCPVYDAAGRQQALYRKIHLFDVRLPDREESYQESWSMYPGNDAVTVDTPIGTVGLTICYDVRFPELYRRLVDDGATVFTVPAAFTKVTGAAHWKTLLSARAIENLAYVIAPGQYGEHPDNRSTFGHSMIIDPWGAVLAEQAEGNCHVAADIDPDKPARLRSEFPALANRRI
ncbi:MAG: carbon-nitrogen hydrolase family protein [Gammaproteobacteria bacterium]|nr:carbon-nitrogen hydrolase family protein [Gammaproteobacteria bacterium]MDH3374309.1 carbon-nitrogen hydrolase family protein [Gammaproteobacteria bacterium]MDH3409249.1 carbon-nitrogen hydrolase family protein [Gammaproteobacteria bacterium]MDH3551752.1 carbon-nitrogen hydrolase family protein [Gammaproteobacteria bacterium]